MKPNIPCPFCPPKIRITTSFFAEEYSLVTPTEDRAALIEEIFNISGTYFASVAPEKAVAELSKYPHIGQQHGEIGSPA